MLTFNEFISESRLPPGEKVSLVSGHPKDLAAAHRAEVDKKQGIVHHHEVSPEGVHKVVHSTKAGVMKTTEFSVSSEKNKTANVYTRKPTEQERKRHGGSIVMPDHYQK